jgi:hypothetical protein
MIRRISDVFGLFRGFRQRRRSQKRKIRRCYGCDPPCWKSSLILMNSQSYSALKLLTAYFLMKQPFVGSSNDNFASGQHARIAESLESGDDTNAGSLLCITLIWSTFANGTKMHLHCMVFHGHFILAAWSSFLACGNQSDLSIPFHRLDAKSVLKIQFAKSTTLTFFRWIHARTERKQDRQKWLRQTLRPKTNTSNQPNLYIERDEKTMRQAVRQTFFLTLATVHMLYSSVSPVQPVQAWRALTHC